MKTNTKTDTFSITETCLEKIPSTFELVVLAAQRARLLHLGRKTLVEELEGLKPIDIAINEIALEVCTRESIIESFNAQEDKYFADTEKKIVPSQPLYDGKGYDSFQIEDEEFNSNDF